MNLWLRVRVLVTHALIPGPGHYLRESLSKTQEVRKSIDCPQEDHSSLPAVPDILSRLSDHSENELPPPPPPHPMHLSGNFRMAPQLPNKPITRAN